MSEFDSKTSVTKILVTGCGGMLAGHLVPLLQENFSEVSLSDHSTEAAKFESAFALDITKAEEVNAAVSKIGPDWIVNCAAYTAVDKAEEEEELATRVNGEAVGNLARAARENSAKFLHVSTDYVFGGSDAPERNGKAYSEEDDVCPCGAYGRSKLVGERQILESYPEGSVIARTSWLHGIHGPNFVDTMLRLGKERDELRIVNDQFGSPTWAGWLAEVMVALVKKDSRGIFHVSSRGGISWFDFASEIFAQSATEVNVETQTTEELGRPAPRPAFSTLDVSKVEKELGEACISWKESVSRHLEARAQSVSKAQ